MHQTKSRPGESRNWKQPRQNTRDLGRKETELTGVKAELLTQEPGAAALLGGGTEDRASGAKLHNILKEQHTATQITLTNTITQSR